MISRYFERILLSIYYYNVKYEDKMFLDAWWQFYHATTYLAVMIIISSINVIVHYVGLEDYNILYSLIPVFAVFISGRIANEFRNTKLYNYIIVNQYQLKPVKLWIVIIFSLLIIFLCAFSFRLV